MPLLGIKVSIKLIMLKNVEALGSKTGEK